MEEVDNLRDMISSKEDLIQQKEGEIARLKVRESIEKL